MSSLMKKHPVSSFAKGGEAASQGYTPNLQKLPQAPDVWFLKFSSPLQHLKANKTSESSPTRASSAKRKKSWTSGLAYEIFLVIGIILPLDILPFLEDGAKPFAFARCCLRSQLYNKIRDLLKTPSTRSTR